MKTNVSIDLNDEDRNKLANMLDGKATARLATRKEIVEICQRHIGGLVEQSSGFDKVIIGVDPAKPGSDRTVVSEVRNGKISPLSEVDAEDFVFLKDKSPSYIRGWNQVKRGGL